MKNGSKFGFLEVFGHFLKEFSIRDPETRFRGKLCRIIIKCKPFHIVFCKIHVSAIFLRPRVLTPCG